MSGIAITGSVSNKRPIAWTYELANYYNPITKEYTSWTLKISFYKPNVPEASIRNLKPLYYD